ncbi:MAG: phenylacetate--CoA ligase family protein [Desulfatiglandales bacterium]
MESQYSNFFNEEMETLTADALHDLHEGKFLKQVEYLYHHSPLYQEKFKSEGIEPGDIKRLEDIVKLPFTQKKELREAQMSNPPVGRHRACSLEQLSRVYSSSGTTGVPTYIGLTSHDIYSVQAEATARICWAGGVRPTSKVVNIPTAPFIADTFREGIEKTGAVHIPTGFNTDRVIAAFQYQGADAMHATVSFWSYLLGEVEKSGINPKELGLRTIIGGAEGGTKLVRPRIEESFGATATEGMGMGEMVCIVFGECVENRGNGMHYLTQGLVHVELVDPETLETIEIKEGATGELVYTALASQAMPLMRYRSRDHVRILSTDKCICGRTGFRIEVLGRTDDMLTVLGVNVYPMAIRDVASSLKPRVSGAIEIQLEKPGPVVEPPLKVKIELGEDPGDRDELKKRLQDLIRDKLICRTRVELVEELPKYQYKTQLIKKLYE